MTQEEKELLIKDLCARLPYKPRVRYHYYAMGAVAINGYSDEGYLSYEKLEDFSIYPKYGLEKTRVYNIVPYLRPMSSMTDEETKYKLSNFFKVINTKIEGVGYIPTLNSTSAIKYIDWLNKNHFDYRGLISMGLALEAPEGMYK